MGRARKTGLGSQVLVHRHAANGKQGDVVSVAVSQREPMMVLVRELQGLLQAKLPYGRVSNSDAVEIALREAVERYRRPEAK